MQWIKDRIVERGPKSPIVQSALAIYARLKGFRCHFPESKIFLEKGSRRLILDSGQYIQVPIMMRQHDLYFSTMVSETRGGHEILDFSRPGVHRYSRSGAAFRFPSIPEDESMDIYTRWYTPNLGDVVWDAGAHAGATSYFLAQMVGPTGKVFAFEPDEIAHEYLLANIEASGLKNIIPVKKALAAHDGETSFFGDGTMAAGIPEYIVYRDASRITKVPCFTMATACEELGGTPTFVKMDIEGAELPVLETSMGFLAEHPIHFAIETNHKVNGQMTAGPIERVFRSIGYAAESSESTGTLYTWARPNPSLISTSPISSPSEE
jgi:FkbM family methyltransferase